MSLRVAVIVIATSAPLALAFETLFRVHVLGRVFGSDLAMVREFLSPPLTHAAWVLVFVTVAAGILGVAIMPAALKKADAAAHKAGETGDNARRKRALERLYLLTSIPQVPAILATFCFTFGSHLLPVIVAMALSTIFVLVQGLVTSRLLHRVGSAP